ncbi:hypothetical protein ACJ41O_000228 [Fusarium nematophilum]
MKPSTLLLTALTLATDMVSANREPSCRPRCTGTCLRALQQRERASAASKFCSSILATTLAPTATPSYPSFLACCGKKSLVQSFSSACRCFMTAGPPPQTTISTVTRPTLTTKSTKSTGDSPTITLEPPTLPPSHTTLSETETLSTGGPSSQVSSAEGSSTQETSGPPETTMSTVTRPTLTTGPDLSTKSTEIEPTITLEPPTLPPSEPTLSSTETLSTGGPTSESSAEGSSTEPSFTEGPTGTSSSDGSSTESSGEGSSTEASFTEEPSTEASATEASSTEPSDTDTSITDTSATETSETQTSGTEISATDTSLTDTSSIDTATDTLTETSGTETSGTGTSATETSVTESSLTDTSSINTSATQTSTETSTSATDTCPVPSTVTDTAYVTVTPTLTCDEPQPPSTCPITVSVTTSTVTQATTTTVTRTSTSQVYCPISTNFVQNPGFETGDFQFWNRISSHPLPGSPPSYGVRCDGDPAWVHSGTCAVFATFGDDTPADSQVSLTTSFDHCFRGAYDIRFWYKITAGCALDIIYTNQVKLTLSPTESPAQWAHFGAGLPWPPDGTGQDRIGWTFRSRKLGAASCGVSLDDFVISGPRPG